MLKEQNVIKIYLVIFLLCALKSFGQEKIQGKYSIPIIFAYKYYDFKDSNIFEYHAGADLGEDEYGKGHYSIKNDSLILNYDLTELKYESYFKAKKYFNSKDSIDINLKIYDFKGNPFSKVMVYSFPIYKSTESDKKGIASIKFKKQEHKKKIKLYVEQVFCAKQVIYLDGDSNYSIEVFMNNSTEQFGHPRLYKNQVVKYKIEEMNDSILKLRDKNSKPLILKKSKI